MVLGRSLIALQYRLNMATTKRFVLANESLGPEPEDDLYDEIFVLELDD